MLKKVIIAALALLLVPALCLAAPCPNYEVGYQGNAKACMFNLTNPVPGVAVKFQVGDLVIEKKTDAAGKYTVKAKVNNCQGAADGTAIGFYTQKWSVTLNMGVGYDNFEKTCSTSATFICCCPQCVQSIIKSCSILFKFCC